MVALSPDPYPRTRETSSRAELVYITLRQDILNNNYRPGQRLSEETIAQELNVSRTPVREALKRLHAEGFVEIRPHRGAVVRDASCEELAELCAVREVLEGLAARLAARSISHIEVYSLERLLAEMEAATAEGRLEDLVNLNFQFHETIWIASRNRYLAHQLRQLRQFVQRLHASTLTVPGRKEESYREHRALFEACAAGDPDAAERLAREHVRKAESVRLMVWRKSRCA